MHPRQKIRKAVFERLQGYDILQALFNARTKFSLDSAMPFCNVITGTETSERDQDDYHERRTLQLFVNLYARDENLLVDTLDDLALFVEDRLSLDRTLNGICESFRYVGADPYYENADDQELGMLTLNYECVYLKPREFEGDVWRKTQIGIDMASPRNNPQKPTGPDGQIDARITIIHSGD